MVFVLRAVWLEQHMILAHNITQFTHIHRIAVYHNIGWPPYIVSDGFQVTFAVEDLNSKVFPVGQVNILAGIVDANAVLHLSRERLLSIFFLTLL